MSDVTQILERVERGDGKAAEELLPLVYEELRKLAAAKMAQERPGQTLQPTALVHEAWLRLSGAKEQTFQNRAHFFGAAAEAMRRILIENARRKSAHRYGGGLERLDLTEIDLPEKAEDNLLLRVDEALEGLRQQGARAADLVKLRFFAGLSTEQAALALGVTDRTARRDWRFARAWLFHVLKDFSA
jgi:RNA polymerase sigma factor (TIGR02999 family)